MAEVHRWCTWSRLGCAGFPVKLSVFSVRAECMSRLLPESSDMICLSCIHDYTDIAAKARLARCSK